MANLKDARDLLDAAREVSRWLRGEKTDSLRLDCMHSLGVYSTTSIIKSSFSKWVRKLGPRSKEFSTDEVYDVRFYALKPRQRVIRSDASRVALSLT